MTKRMKLNVKDLAPNPFRDISNYPIDKEKVESLKASINETGFWDNVIARKPSYANYYEIAYGHHRLQALREIVKESGEDVTIEVPVKHLSDSLMLKIMANENMEAWSMGARVIDETVKATKKFLEEHPEEIRTKEPKFVRVLSGQTGEYLRSPLAFQIAEFLGSGWSEKRIYNSMQRLDMIESKVLDKEAVMSMPSPSASDTFAQVVKKEKLTPVQQKKAASEIIRSGNVGRAGIEAAARIVKNPPSPTPKKIVKKLPTDFDQSMSDLASDIRKVNKGLDDLYRVLDEHGDIVVDKIVAVQLTTSMKSLYYKVEKILKALNQID